MTARANSYIVRGMLALLLIAFGAYLHLSPAPGNKSAGPPEKISLSYALIPETALAQIAQSNGYFQQENLEVSPHFQPFGQLSLQDVIDGKADFATVAETPFMFAVMNGEALSIVATIQSSNVNNAIVARRDLGIVTPKDLRGRKIAITSGTTSEFFADSFLVMQGIALKEVTTISMKPADLQSALLNGRVDAASAFQPFLRQIEKKMGERAATFTSADIYTETFHIVAKQSVIEKNPEAVRKILRALIRAEEFLRQHPAEAKKIVEDFCHFDRAVLDDIWDGNTFSISLTQSLLLTLEDESRWAVRNGLTRATRVPNYLNHIYLDGLKSVKPDAVNILR